MFDAFPFDEWNEKVADFWTFGPGGSTGTYIILALGVVLMIASLIGFVRQESKRLADQAARLQKDGFLVRMTQVDAAAEGESP